MATTNKNFKVKNGLDVGGNAAITGDANVAGKLSVTARSGDEGGEIFLANAVTNTTIPNGVTIDVYQNKLRFFEQGGDARGYYIDITGGGSAASTNLVGGGSASDSFRTISANGTSVVADSSTDTLTITPGDNVQIAGNATSDTITFTVNGALSNITSIVTPNYITFDTTPTGVSSDAGTMYWDSGDGIPKVVLNANVSIGIGQESILLVKNATGSTLTKGSVVYINGAQGQNPTVALADADTEATSSKTFGFVAEQILDTAEGYVVTEGILRGVNTLGFTEGGAIWLSSTAGGYTQTIPDEPAHSVFLGYAVKAHETAGEIIVKIQNGYELTELHGVTISNTAATNDILQLNSSGIWVNANLATANIANLAAATNTFTGNVNATTFNGSGAGLTSIPAANLTGTAANIVYTANIGSTVQAYDADLTAIAALSNSAGYLYNNGSGTFSYATPTDTNTTYTFTATGTSTASLTLTPSSGSANTVTITGAGGTVVSQASNAITLTSPQVWTQDTQPVGNIGDIWIDTNSSPADIVTVARLELERNAAQNFTDGTTATVNFDTTIENVGVFTISSGVVTIPKTGRYSVAGQINWDQNGTNRRVVHFTLNSVDVWSQYAESTSEAGGFRQQMSVPSMRMSAGDLFEFRGRHDAGTTTAVNYAHLVLEYLGA